MASLAEALRKQVAAAKVEYRAKRADLERQLAQLDRDYAVILGGIEVGNGRRRGGGRRSAGGLGYGKVREAVLAAIKAGKGMKPAQIAEQTGLASAQVHNSLTALKKGKSVRVKDGLYSAV